MNSNLPLISVIITTKNEEKNIKNCLNSIKDQSYPFENIEIIVVDNNSTDKTKEKVEEFKRGFTLLNTKLFNQGPERSAQRNYGVEKSSGEYFLYLDADMTLHKDVIKDCVSKIGNWKLEIGNSDLVGLYISEIVTGNSFWSKVRRFERSFYDGTVIDCVRFIKKEAFQKVGGFNESLTGPEDWDLDKKIRNAGRACPVARSNTGACPVASNSSATGVDLIKTPIYHNEAEFNLKKYLEKKSYYSKSFEKYIDKWGKNDQDIKKQFGFYYRFFGVFVEKGKLAPSNDWGWKKIVSHPILTGGMYFLRFLVGINFLFK